MSTFRVLISGDEFPNVQQVMDSLQEMGLEVRTSRWLTDLLDQPYSTWSALLIDVEGVSNLLRGLLPTLRRRFPNLTMIGLMSRSAWEKTSLAFDCPATPDAPENVIVMFPYGAGKRRPEARYALGETAPLPAVGLI